MAAARRRLLTLGGEGSCLTPSDIANGFSDVSIDSSVISCRSCSPNSGAVFPISIPGYFTPEEARASLLSLLNKLVLSYSSPAACDQLVEILNSNAVSSNYTLNDVASDELAELDFSAAAFAGVSALVVHGCSALASISEAVAALSCEALGADVSPFNLVDSGDGFSAKDAVAVAAHFRAFFNGSKLVNSNKGMKDSSVAEIPLVYGYFREICRFLYSKTRAELNSGFRAGSMKCLSTTLLPLASTLSNLGNSSVRRTGHVLSSVIYDVDLCSHLSDMLADLSALPSALELSSRDAFMKRDYSLFLHTLDELLHAVRNIVSLEAVAAFVSLESLEGQRDNLNKRRGNGTNAIMQFMSDRVLFPTTKYDLGKCVQSFLSLFDPMGPGFDDLLAKVKEIVESNELQMLQKQPVGTRDLAGEQMALRERAFAIVVQVFKRHGGKSLLTPLFELREVFMDKYGEDSKFIYNLADEGGELCSLRYDLKVPFARHVAEKGLTSCKMYQIAKVYRKDNPSNPSRRYREFYQCDFNIAGGHEKMGPDFEVIRILIELLEELGIEDYEVKLNHMKLLDGMLVIFGVPQEKLRSIYSSIDKMGKQSFDQAKREMVDIEGLTEDTANKIESFVKHIGSPMELLSQLKAEYIELLSNSESVVDALNELEMLFKAVAKTKLINKLVFDLSLVRGMDYYTGVIFEAVYKGATEIRSVATGGRYDNLVRKEVPAVGVSLEIERVFVIMEQLQKDKKQEIRATEIQVLVSILRDDDLSLAVELVNELWDAKLNAEFMVDKKLSNHVERAKGSKIPYIAIVGDYELSRGIVKLKDMTKLEFHDDENVPRNTLVAELQQRLGIRGGNGLGLGRGVLGDSTGPRPAKTSISTMSAPATEVSILHVMEQKLVLEASTPTVP